MKGLVFTTYYNFCEKSFGADVLDDVIESACLPHSGAYTSVGTYPFEEMVSLVVALTKRTEIGMSLLLEQFGEFCFQSWVSKFPKLFQDRDIFDVLENIDAFHEAEVRKLYPDAELPSFQVVERQANELILVYKSCKPLADLAVGVIRGASEHLRNPVVISYSSSENGVRFSVVRAVANRAAA